MRMTLVSAAVAVILALMGTPLVIWAFGRRSYRQQIMENGTVAHATKRATPTMGGTVIVIATLAGYVAGHALTRDPMAVSGVLVLVLMTGLGLAGFAGDFIKTRRQASPGPHNAAKLAHSLDGLETGAAILVLAAYFLIFNWQLRSECTVVLMQNCYLVRNPLDLAAVAASVLGACFGFFWWNAQRARIFMGATGTFALGGVLAGLAVTAPTQLLLAVGGLVVIITLSAIRRWADRLPIRAPAVSAHLALRTVSAFSARHRSGGADRNQVGAVAGLLAGLYPAWRASRVSPISALQR